MSTMDTPDPETGVADLTAFQRDVLWALANDGGALHGLGIKAQLDDYYPAPVNHGRLYPNLDVLIEGGFLEKGTIDDRTNEYQLTERARAALSRRQAWMEGTA